LAHVIPEKKKLVLRVRRVRGQVEAIERAIESDEPCERTIQTIASVRGALMGLMSEMIEDHLTNHVLEKGSRPTLAQARATKDLMAMIKAYLK
jgi:DNA-binding FrmR family transcriptional regulator